VGPRFAARPFLRPAFLGDVELPCCYSNCPRTATPFCVGVDSPTALFYINISAHPIKALDSIYCACVIVINGELGQFALYHQNFMWLPCLCFSCRTSLQNSVFACCVLSIACECSCSYQRGTFSTVSTVTGGNSPYRAPAFPFPKKINFILKF
jgi:hypothetical protein